MFGFSSFHAFVYFFHLNSNRITETIRLLDLLNFQNYVHAKIYTLSELCILFKIIVKLCKKLEEK